jgi:poly-gamma-glutamate capsule biosynthesis protein CapA/YwtB (metallophosphatase superfamily)/outer membrane protein assembly factor BamB
MVWAVVSTDLDGDGREEIVAASYDKHVYTLAHDGHLLWSYRTDGPVYSLGVGDLDGDGRAEVLAGGDDNSVHALAADGTLLWVRRMSSRVTSLSVGDVEGDGTGEVLVGCWDGGLWLLGPDGEPRWQTRGEGGVSVVHLVDLDHDGNLEALAGDQGGAVSLTNASGAVQWTYATGGRVTELTVHDLEGDGGNEIVVGSADGWLYALNDEGGLEWKRLVGDSVLTLDVADVEGDGTAEIAVGTGPHAPAILLLDHRGQARWEYDLRHSVWAVRVADVDRDGRPEVLAGGDDGMVRVLDCYRRLLGTYETERRVHGLGLARSTDSKFEDIVARSGNDVYLLTLDSAQNAGEETEGSPQAVTLPEWIGPLPGLAEGGDDFVELVAVGDLMLSRTVEERTEVYGSTYPFEAVAELLRGADIAVGTLECPLTVNGDPIDKRFLFRAHPRNADALAWAGFDVLNLATNHVLDFGQEGFEQTLEALRGAGLPYVGAGLSSEEAHAPVVKEVRGRRIAFLAYAATRWKGSQEVPTSELISFAELATIREDVQRTKQLADLVVVIMHLGTEYQLQPDDEQLAVSRAAIDAGACLVIGHHPHVVQETAVYHGGFIAYSLGNFVFDIDTTEGAREGAILRVLLGDTGVEAVDLVPVRIVDDVQPRLIVGEDGLPLVRQVFRASAD